LAAVPADDAGNRRGVIGVVAVAAPLVSPPPGRVVGVGVPLAFFPPRSGTSRRPPPTLRSAATGPGRPVRPGLAGRGATPRGACGRSPARGPAWLLACPGRSRAGSAPTAGRSGGCPA